MKKNYHKYLLSKLVLDLISFFRRVYEGIAKNKSMLKIQGRLMPPFFTEVVQVVEMPENCNDAQM